MAVQFSRGVFTAPALQVAPCGLLSVADVETHSGNPQEDQWIRGFSSLTNVAPTVRLLTTNNDIITDGELFDGTDEPGFYNVSPFWIEVETKNTAKNLVSDNPLDGKILEQVKAATQKALEFELWEGAAAQAVTDSPNGYLIKEDGAEVVTTAGMDAAEALARLEQAISLSPVGGRGIIHVTRDVASTLGSRLLYKANSRDDDNAYAVTRLGTLVVIGSGYTGNGPLGVANREASATNKWMFATGGIEAHLGKAEVVNDSLAQGFNPATNDSIVKVERPVAVHFDPSIYYAAQVTLS